MPPTSGPPLSQPGALPRHEVTSKPSSLFSLFFPKIYSERHLLCRRNPRLRPIGSRKEQQRASLFLALIEIAWDFADLRTPSNSPARPQDMGRAGPPIFAENLQALTISFAITTPPLSKSSYYYLSHRRNAVIRPRHSGANYYENTQLPIRK